MGNFVIRPQEYTVQGRGLVEVHERSGSGLQVLSSRHAFNYSLQHADQHIPAPQYQPTGP